mmetsp:Transcript_55036/g.141684  ORF Transcript_55036/g.141684 Transcript_55036/m.141684 type:complete len:281 (-) Transcript_55036:25-867(-)
MVSRCCDKLRISRDSSTGEGMCLNLMVLIQALEASSSALAASHSKCESPIEMMLVTSLELGCRMTSRKASTFHLLARPGNFFWYRVRDEMMHTCCSSGISSGQYFAALCSTQPSAELVTMTRRPILAAFSSNCFALCSTSRNRPWAEGWTVLFEPIICRNVVQSSVSSQSKMNIVWPGEVFLPGLRAFGSGSGSSCMRISRMLLARSGTVRSLTGTGVVCVSTSSALLQSRVDGRIVTAMEGASIVGDISSEVQPSCLCSLQDRQFLDLKSPLSHLAMTF